jgi:hypothetical protein
MKYSDSRFGNTGVKAQKKQPLNKPEIEKKPEKSSGFEKPVAWLLGRQLIANLKFIALYVAFKGKLDPRDWMSTKVYSFTNEVTGLETEQIGQSESKEAGEFWFDYLSDTGDGQMAIYSIAYLCMSNLCVEAPIDWNNRDSMKVGEDNGNVRVRLIENSENIEELKKKGNSVLPVGSFLFVGGDTSYHIADYATLADRFQKPFWWAHEDRLEAGISPQSEYRPILAIPGNHDYYDALDGFNRQFRRPATGEDVSVDQRGPLLALPTFERCQEASYLALQLPYGWWMWGFDTENGDMDFRQREFFKQIKEKVNPQKLIIATSQPTTVFGKYAKADEALAKEFAALDLERPFLKGSNMLDESKCRLDLSGDVHHYARYWGPDANGGSRPQAVNYASVVSGLGGAFLHPSQTDVGELEEQVLFPSKENSRAAVSRQILNFWNLFTGGFVWLIGVILAFIIYFGATIPQSSRQAIDSISILRDLGITQPEPTNETDENVPADKVYSWGVKAATRPPGHWIRVSSLTVSVITVILLVVYTSRMFKKIYSKMLKKTGEFRKPPGLFKITTSREFWPLWILFAVAVASLAYGMWEFAKVDLTPFGSSLLILVSLVWATAAIAESLLYSEWLFHQAYSQSVKWYDYWPVWALVNLGIAAVSLALWNFGKYNVAAALTSDVIFSLTIFAVLFGLIFLAVGLGGALQSKGGKVLFGFFGLWHGLLQLLVPFLFIVRGSHLSFSLAVISIFLFRFIGIGMARKQSKWIAGIWLLYGASLLYLPFLPYPPLFSSVGLVWKFLIVGAVGAVMSCVNFGWYLAVSLAFNGHNNEAGGASRIEEYKEFIRIRITPDDLTAYVIGFVNPQIDGREIDIKIIDKFKLKCNQT